MDIQFLIMDVDGTLTDGKIYIGKNGEMMKAFNIKDGYGISVILKQINVLPIIVTGRKSKITENRASELGIKQVYQNIGDKQDFVLKKFPNLGSVAYIGDDDNDLSLIQLIKKHGGITGCPNNASTDIKKEVNYISSFNGGDGAVRDFIEWIKQIKE